MRTKFTVLVEYGDGQTLTSNDTRIYNVDDAGIKVIKKTNLNSYGGCVSTEIKMIYSSSNEE